MFRQFTRNPVARHNSAKSSRRAAVRPKVERLEDRTAPSVGTLDPTFGAAGTAATNFGSDAKASAVALHQHGNVLAAGTAGGHFALADYLPNGSPNPRFGSGGRVTTDFGGPAEAHAVAIQVDGKIIVAGNAVVPGSGGMDFALTRYNPDGTPDASFGTGGQVVTDLSQSDDYAYAVAVQSNGKIVVAGSTVGADGFGSYAVVRYNFNGSLDATFGTNGVAADPQLIGNDGASTVAIQADGKIVAAGWSYLALSSDVSLVRYNSDGTIDIDGAVSVGGDPGVFGQQANALAVRPDGRIVLAGICGLQPFVAQLLPDGSDDSAFGSSGHTLFTFLPGSIARVTGLKVQPDGRVVATVGDNSQFGFGLVRFTAAGTLDPQFGTGGRVFTPLRKSGSAEAVALQVDGRIVAAGWRESRSGVMNFAVARYDAAFKLIKMSEAGGALTVQGTGRADAVAIADDGAGNITVSSLREDVAPITVPGVTSVTINTFGGDDDVRVGVSPGGRGGALPLGFHPAELAIQLGSGNDRCALNAYTPASSSELALSHWKLSIDAGVGNDMIHFDARGSLALWMAVDLGAGIDFATIDSEGLAEMPAESYVAVRGAAGRDDIRVIYGFVIEGGTPVPPQSPVTVDLDGGFADDWVSVDWNVAVRPGSPTLPPSTFNIPLVADVHGGDGNDDVRVTHGIVIEGGTPAPDVHVAAPISIDIDGAGGNDHVLVALGSYPSFAGLQTAVTLDAPVSIVVHCSAGNDSAIVRTGPGDAMGLSGPAPAYNDTFKVLLDGGDGNDVAELGLTFNGRSTGSLDAQVLGGRGQDDLTLAAIGTDGGSLAAQIDGGGGIDTARHTANVRVANCER